MGLNRSDLNMKILALKAEDSGSFSEEIFHLYDIFLHLFLW